MPVRRPAVAGQFYASEPDELKASLEECFVHRLGPGKKPPADRIHERIFGFVMPHAGYMYSGPIAAHGYYLASSQTSVELVAIVGPNHWGTGSGVATVRGGLWETPLGQVEVDREAAERVAKASGIIDFDEQAHRQEHSLEVQIPFLQYIYGSAFKILPISMALQDAETAVEVGKALAEALKEKRGLLIASSDLTHYETHETASQKDGEFIKAVLEMDVTRHYTVLHRLDVSACGYGPIAAVMTACKSLGATSARLLRYATSGDITGDRAAVVGYASIAFL